jgi:hypothetical protein
MSQEDELHKLREELQKSKEKNADLELQLKMRESERDLLAVMLCEAEDAAQKQRSEKSDWSDRDNIRVGILLLTDFGTIQTTNRCRGKKSKENRSR